MLFSVAKSSSKYLLYVKPLFPLFFDIVAFEKVVRSESSKVQVSLLFIKGTFLLDNKSLVSNKASAAAHMVRIVILVRYSAPGMGNILEALATFFAALYFSLSEKR